MSEQPNASAITIQTRERAVIATPHLKMIDDEALKTLGRLIDESMAANPVASLVIVDLSHVSILPSLALGLLVQISNKCKSREQKLKLAGVQPAVRKVFAITRLDRIFQFADTVDAAME